MFCKGITCVWSVWIQIFRGLQNKETSKIRVWAYFPNKSPVWDSLSLLLLTSWHSSRHQREPTRSGLFTLSTFTKRGRNYHERAESACNCLRSFPQVEDNTNAVTHPYNEVPFHYVSATHTIWFGRWRHIWGRSGHNLEAYLRKIRAYKTVLNKFSLHNALDQKIFNF